jgi:hypothetical protein
MKSKKQIRLKMYSLYSASKGSPMSSIHEDAESEFAAGLLSWVLDEPLTNKGLKLYRDRWAKCYPRIIKNMFK